MYNEQKQRIKNFRSQHGVISVHKDQLRYPCCGAMRQHLFNYIKFYSPWRCGIVEHIVQNYLSLNFPITDTQILMYVLPN